MVYVDTPDNRGWSHLIADSVEELHEFASNLGLKREWFQNKPGHPHYDLVRNLRTKAIKDGATKVTRQELATRLNTLYGEVK